MMAPNKGLLCFGPTFADPEDSYIEKEDDIAVMKATDLNMDKKLVDADEKSENENKPESNITEECVAEDESDHTTDIESLEMRKCLVHNDGISRREDDGRSKTEREGVAMRRMCSRLDGKYWTDVQMLDVSGCNVRMSPRVKTPTRKCETVEKETGKQVRGASVKKLNLTM